MFMSIKSQAKEGLNLNLHRLVYLVDDLTNKTLKAKKIDLTNSQYLILKCIFILDNPSQREIADYICTSSAAVSRQVTLLTKKNYIKVKNCDRRTHEIHLTSKGKALLKRSLRILHKEIQKEFGDLSELSDRIRKMIG